MTFNDKALEGDMRDRQVFLINYGKPIITCKSIPTPPHAVGKVVGAFWSIAWNWEAHSGVLMHYAHYILQLRWHH